MAQAPWLGAAGTVAFSITRARYIGVGCRYGRPNGSLNWAVPVVPRDSRLTVTTRAGGVYWLSPRRSEARRLTAGRGVVGELGQFIGREVGRDYFKRYGGANSRATFELLRAAGDRMRDRGRFLLISTGAIRVTSSDTGLYAASKTVAEHLIRVAARALAGRGITVNSILAGHTETDALKSPPLAGGLLPSDSDGRLRQPEDIADAIALLTSSDARWITGQSVTMDGGLTA